MHLQAYGLGDATSLQAQWDSWYGTIQNLNKSLAIARQTNNVAMEAQVRAAITWVLQQMSSLNQQMTGQEMPSALLQSMDRAADAAIQTAKDVGAVPVNLIKDVGAIASGAARTVSWLPFILIGAIAVLGLGFAKGGLQVKI